MDIKERTSAILDKIMEVASSVDSVKDNTKRIVILEEENAMLKEESAILKEENAMLTECVLELSSIIYA